MFTISKIKSVKPLGRRLVCDISVGEDASYIGNGFVNHNSCTKPNMQQIPRVTTNPYIKQMFLPPPGYLLLEIDYSQAELRIVAELAKDEVMIDIFRRGYNIHVGTACSINGKLDEYNRIKGIIDKAELMSGEDLKKPENKDFLFWRKEKKRAKTINFGIIYGQGARKLAVELDCSEDEAQQIIDDWLDTYPAIKIWIEEQQKYAQENGYVYNIFGRKRRLPNAMYRDKWRARDAGMMGKFLEALRQSVNAPIQGGSSDLCQLSAIEIWEQKQKGLLPHDLHQLYTVHDSIGFAIRPELIHKVVPKVVAICDNPNTEKWFGFKMHEVKMKVSPEIGTNWANLKDYNQWENYTKLVNINTI